MLLDESTRRREDEGDDCIKKRLVRIASLDQQAHVGGSAPGNLKFGRDAPNFNRGPVLPGTGRSLRSAREQNQEPAGIGALPASGGHGLLSYGNNYRALGSG